MSDLNELQNKVIAFRDARDWKQFHNPKDVAISLTLEASEYLEHFQWKSPEQIKKHLKNHKEDVSDELADILYYTLLAASDLDIDLKKALIDKIHKNDKKYPVAKAKGSSKKYTVLTKEREL